MIISKLLPEDTRLAEIASGFALLLLSFLLSLEAIVGVTKALSGIGAFVVQPSPFWVVLLLALGVLQLFAIASYPRAEALRVAVAWIAGTLWVWMSLEASVTFDRPVNAAALTLGLANFYGCLVNFLLLRHKWTN